MNSVQHFEIPADNMGRAQNFYNRVFGWHLAPFDSDTVMVYTAPTDENNMLQAPGAINGDISKRNEHFQYPLLVITVPSIDEKTEEILANGGRVISDKVPIPDMGAYTYVEDSEGNVIGIWEALT